MGNESSKDYNQIRADKAFDKAIKDGIFSEYETARNWFGHYVFMGLSVSGTRLSFKHRDTRQYIYAERN